jgi:FtsZ-interacting cell division protein ZipA
MDAWMWVVIAVIVVAAVVVAASTMRKRRSDQLRSKFGPEYERTLSETGSRKEAEQELKGRTERHEKLDIRPLEPAARERYTTTWTETQAHFVDDPKRAVEEADALIVLVMRDRGYPVDDFEQRAADVSVEHPQVVENYRSAQAISVASREGRATTEDLRQGMVHYRALFSELLQAPTEDESARTDERARVVELREQDVRRQ